MAFCRFKNRSQDWEQALGGRVRDTALKRAEQSCINLQAQSTGHLLDMCAAWSQRYYFLE